MAYLTTIEASRISALKGLVVPTASVPEAALACSMPAHGFDTLDRIEITGLFLI